MMSKLDLWNSVSKTPPEHTKPITGKSYSGTSPKPQWLIMKATETFGPCGIGWGFTIDERVEDGAMIAPGFYHRMHIAKVKVWYIWNSQRGEVEHIGGTEFSGLRSSGKPFTDEDAAKKSVTDALVKALSMIGFAGDIFMGRYDDSKYVQELRDEQREANRPPSANAAPRQANDKATEAYKVAFKFAVDKCDFESEVRQLWADQAAERKKLGIGKDSRIEELLIGYCKDRVETFAKADDRAETMGEA